MKRPLSHPPSAILYLLFCLAAASARASSLPLWTAGLTNFWTLPGDSIGISANGVNFAASNGVIIITLGTNTLLSSPPTAGNGNAWQLSGRVAWDGANLNSRLTLNPGDPAQPVVPALVTIPNAGPVTNVVLTLAVAGETNNLTLAAAAVSASRAPRSGPALMSWPPPSFQIPVQTIPSASSSTLGQGAGLMCVDSNYLYISIGTNTWLRFSIPTNTW